MVDILCGKIAMYTKYRSLNNESFENLADLAKLYFSIQNIATLLA